MKRIIKISYLIIITILLFNNLLISQTNLKPTKYFPLKVGNYWLYKLAKTGTIEKRISEYLPSKSAYVLEQLSKFSGTGSIKSITIYRTTNSKIYLLGAAGVFKPKIEWKDSPYLILDYPLRIGRQWTEYKDKDETKINQVIDFVDCKVTAGKFKNVCKIKTTISYLWENKIEKIISYDFYAPNVGLIKQEGVDKDGTVYTVFELINYNIK